MDGNTKRDTLRRLKIARGHLDSVIEMVEKDTYCVDLMKQVSAVQGSLERTNRGLLETHLKTCVSEAITVGEGDEKIGELMEALRYDKSFTGPIKVVSSEEA